MAMRFTVTDYSGENSIFSIPVAEPTAVNFNADFTAGGGGTYDDLLSAIQTVTIGNVTSARADAYEREPEPGLPASPFAQVETGLRLTMQETGTGATFSRTLAAPDLAALATPGTDVVALDNAALAPLVAAINAGAVGPSGAAVTVIGAVIIGRAR